MSLATNEVEFEASISGHMISNLRYADDIGLLTVTAPDRQSLVNSVDITSSGFGLRVSSAKTEVQQGGRVSQSLNISLGTTTLTQANNFVYLGGTLSCDATRDQGITRRVGLATGIMRKFVSIWNSPDINKETKVKLYQTLVQSILLYNADTWTLKEGHKRKLCVTSRDRRRNIDINKELSIVSDVLMVLQQRRLTYFGHVVRMGPEIFPSLLLYGHASGTRTRGRPI